MKQKPRQKRQTTFTDHEGNTFKTLDEMCAYWHVAPGTYDDRHRKHWTIKECLLGKPKITDPNNISYNSIKDMCIAWNIRPNTYAARIKKGYTMLEALTGNKQSVSPQIKDHLNNGYTSIDEMCQAYGITKSIWYQRRHKGWSVEKTLTTKIKAVTKHEHTINDRTDHNGTIYASVNEMCKSYQIDTLTYQRRLERGWTKEKALTEDIDNNIHGKPVQDPFGTTYSMLKDMLDAYAVNFSTYNQRIHSGYSLPEALGIIPLLNNQIKEYVISPELTILENIEENTEDAKQFFLCMFKEHEIIMHRTAIIQYYLNIHNSGVNVS